MRKLGPKEIRRRFRSNDNYYWINLSWKPRAIDKERSVTSSVLFAEKLEACCDNPSCPGMGKRIGLKSKKTVYGAINEQQLREHLREHPYVLLVEVGPNEAAIQNNLTLR